MTRVTSKSPDRHDLLRPRLKRFTRVLHGLEGGHSRAVHQTRVASRRLRELIPVLQLEPRLAARLLKRLRRVTRALGPVREADVLLQLIEERQSAAPDGEAPALAIVAEHIRTGRERARSAALDKATVAELHRLARKLQRLEQALATSVVPVREARAWRWALEARTARRAEALMSAMQAAGAVYLAERLHGVRIALKKLRYAVELLDEAGGRLRARDLRQLKRVQDTLGRLHDMQVLLDHVRQTQALRPRSGHALPPRSGQAAEPPPDLAAWRHFDSLVRGLERDCRVLHARYMRGRHALETLCQRLVERPAMAARRAG